MKKLIQLHFKKILSSRSLLVALAFAGCGAENLFAQGALTPPGAPVPTMKTLDQVEARTAITNRTSLVTISQPGSYYLTGNLTVSTGDGIDINTNGVTLDLNGFNILSTAASATGTGILLGSGSSDITILNGHIRGGVTNNGSGTYSGTGFANGIYYSGFSPENVMVSRLSVSGCSAYGIYLNTLQSTMVESCTVRTVGSFGIFASVVKSCVATDCRSDAITGDQVSDSRGASSANGGGIDGNVVLNCTGSSLNGDAISAIVAQNCYGRATGTGRGIAAATAQNCYGVSANGVGLYAANTATGCYGASPGIGLTAFIANSCSGSSLSVSHNLNSY